MMDSSEEYGNYRNLLEDNRDTIVKVLDVHQFFSRLRSDSIFNLEDEQRITNDVRLSTNSEKAGAFLDKLATKGQMGFKVFLGMLETRYPELYKQLSGKDPVLQEHDDLSSMGETCQQHRDFIQKLAVDNAEMAAKVQSYKNQNDQLSRKLIEIQRNNDILKNKHNKHMKKLQHYDALQQKLKMRQHELNDLTTQQRNILAKSLQFQQEKEAIQRRLRSSNVEITDLKRQLIEAQEHHKRKSQIMSSTRRANIPRAPSLDSAQSMEAEIERLRRELSASRDSTDVDVEVAILRDDLRDKTAECERLADEWQRTQKELNNVEEERIVAISDLEDARYACQNCEREALRYKQLYELNIKHSDRTEEDLKKAREDRNSLETHVDSLLREQRDLLYRLQDLQNRNMNLSHEKSVLTKAIKNSTQRRKKGGSPDLGYAGGSQSGSSKESSPRNSMEEYKSLGSIDAKSSTKSADTSTKPKERSKLHLNIQNDSIDSDSTGFRPRTKAISSPIVRSPFRFRESGNIYATLQRQFESTELNKADSMQNLSCSSIESNSDRDDASSSSNTLNRPLARQRKVDQMSMDANPGSKRNRFTLSCFGGTSLAIDDDVDDKNDEVVSEHRQIDDVDYDDDDDDEDPYDYPEEYKRRSMSLNDINILCSDYDFVDLSKSNKK